MARSFGWSMFAILLVGFPSDAHAFDAELSAEQRKLNLESFEQVWQTIRDKHWDPKLGGLDWQAIHDEVKPKIEKAASMDQARDTLNAMIHKLGQSHFQIIPRVAYKELDKPGESKASGDGTPGFDVRVVDGAALVTEVDADSPAAKAGVRLGWKVEKIKGEDLAPAIAKVAEAYKTSRSLELYLARLVQGRLRGAVGKKLDVAFRDGENREIHLEIPFEKPRGTPARLGNLPTIYVQHEMKKLEPNIVYFRLGAFFDPENVMKAFEKAVSENPKANGFILDLRGNPGGIGFMAVGMAGFFVKQHDFKLGTMTTRLGELNFVMTPRPETFDGPLAVLVDGLSASTSEIIAGGLKDVGRARIFGTTTAGAALPSMIEKLPNGDGFQYAIADYVSSGGKRLEGAGVKPDTEVGPSRAALLQGRDAVLQEAIKWIESQAKSK
jgi:carboxyl-terminal processing protease